MRKNVKIPQDTVLESKKQKKNHEFRTYLARKALERLEEQLNEGKDPLCFDPQGFCSIALTLPPEKCIEYDQTDGKQVMVSIDVESSSKLSEAFKQWITDPVVEKPTLGELFAPSSVEKPTLEEAFEPSPDLTTAMTAFKKSLSKRSITPLQDEMEKHMRLFARVLQHCDDNDNKEIDESTWKKVVEDAALRINKLVRAETQKAFLKATQKGDLDIRVINEHFDKARKTLPKKCKQALLDALCDEIGIDRFDHFYNNKIKKKITNHAFKSTTALAMDEFILDLQTGLSTYITGTPYTAHDKKPGRDHLALRHVARNRLKKTPEGKLDITPLQHVSHQSRIPSPVVVFDKKPAKFEDQVKDTKEKLQYARQQIVKEIGNEVKIPIVYCLLTSLHSDAYDQVVDRKNRQRLSAKLILCASHQLNKEAWEKSQESQESYIFVQNIGTNQHTIDLGYHHSDFLYREATLMADVSLLYILNLANSHLDVFKDSKQIKGQLDPAWGAVLGNYEKFLAADCKQQTRYFAQWDAKNEKVTEKKIRDLKQFCRPKVNKEDSEKMKLPQLVTHALLKLYSRDLHHKKQYGMLVQVLSTYLAKISLVGCKSADERTLHLLGRVELLESLGEKLENETPFEGLEEKLVDKLQKFVRGDGVSDGLDALQEALDSAYNQRNLHGAGHVISTTCQGMGAKIRPDLNSSNPGVIKNPDTNVAETGHLFNLKSKHAGRYQPHKFDHAAEAEELSQNIIKAHPQHPKSNGYHPLNAFFSFFTTAKLSLQKRLLSRSVSPPDSSTSHDNDRVG
ncbi:MAG: hypothetical protein A3F17_00970 [Gammaproteobacteria bacterium RIFCSPHIGHO2_12_FULL_41_15]|nr:MAG: hypothetical protein A3F17_00970 [Gammaproteobacteria bacterium RIFCSPHIGHO2_12_FULL_41_15]